jgi:hypothetical protein
LLEPVLPLPVPPVLGVVGLGAGVGLVVLPPDMLPLADPPVVAPAPASLRFSRRQVSRCVPVRPTHLLGTSVDAPVEALPLAPVLPLAEPGVAGSLALGVLVPVALEPDAEPLPEDWAMAAEDRARRAAAVAAVSAFNIMVMVS